MYLSLPLFSAQRISDKQVRVADHPEAPLDAPVDHRLDHDVRDVLDVRVVFFDADIAARRLSSGGVEVPAVPRAAEHTVLDRAFAQWPALVWAGCIAS